MRNLIIFLVVILASLCSGEIIDRIAAIVGDEIILQSEVDQIVNQQLIYNSSNKDKEIIKNEVLESLLAGRILYDEAVNDTTITVDEDEVESYVDNRVKNILAKVGGEEVLLKKYNMTIAKLKSDSRDETKKTLFIDKLKRKKMSSISIGRREVESFYNQKKDSLPEIKANISLAELVVKFDNKLNNSLPITRKLQEIKEEIVSGKITFEEAAKKYSEDVSSAQGGDIGRTKRFDLVSEYETAAYNMKVGDISEPVKTQFGFHLIKLTEKNGEEIRTSHILIKPKLSDSAEVDALARVELLVDSVKNKDYTFEEIVRKYSDNESTKLKNGDLGNLLLEDLDSDSQKLFSQMSIGEITKPVKRDDGYYVYKVNDKQGQHKVSLETDYSKLKDWALSEKRDKELKKWIDDLKKKVFIEIK